AECAANGLGSWEGDPFPGASPGPSRANNRTKAAKNAPTCGPRPALPPNPAMTMENSPSKQVAAAEAFADRAGPPSRLVPGGRGQCAHYASLSSRTENQRRLLIVSKK